MTHSQLKPVSLVHNFKTKSGKPITIGYGSGTAWQWKKKLRPEGEKHTIVQELVDQVALALTGGTGKASTDGPKFNHIDTAEIYTTHPEIAAGIKKSGIKREDVWITTKYCTGFGSFEAPSLNAGIFIEKALKELETDYIDLLLIHSPFLNAHGETLESTWGHFVAAKKAGKVREIGVSNFALNHLDRIFKVAGSPEFHPVVNQVEFHPYLQNQSKGLLEYSQKHNILVEAFGPLSPLFRVKKDGEVVEDHPLKTLLPELADKYGKTEAQILLRYTLQKGILPITTSSKADRIKQSLEIYEFELDSGDVKAIDLVQEKFKFRGFFEQFFDENDLPKA